MNANFSIFVPFCGYFRLNRNLDGNFGAMIEGLGKELLNKVNKCLIRFWHHYSLLFEGGINK